MAENDPGHVDRLARLVRPVVLVDFVSQVCQWLQDAHDEAGALQKARVGGHRGGWANNTSFGTDRHQYLLNTAESLEGEIERLEVAPAFQSVLLKLPHAGIYQFHMPSGPDGAVGETSDLRRELMTLRDEQSLFGRREAWLGHRELLLLPWSGDERRGLTDTWAGQGVLEDGYIVWEWKVRLQDIAAGGYGHPGYTELPTLFNADVFEQPQPDVPLRPRRDPAERAG
ncbi:hypothetical protein [Actinocrispum sp. NPDC049592]|uniref:hypothetical protein n=1 Tax=Actinocrispum sp. NPDC049592 TaxID=3154835 RepID=UPI003424DD4D